ncbi:ABC transporter ATP-binding protein [Tepidibacillus infernus]|uniref:ABC transporter n=1 Tax=Tepidibacillus decaturensis TaxID=1413211 RepID=A0A135L0L5_9BACI|nr:MULTISPECIES: ABC transporter ATP-binding protein [Tepidibacillus]KXG42520.1 ABC transporter [Tepidibacillus decaturensis]GBF11879.1 bicarbonate transport ATP-binding protein CmpD [Tepidibacillus sp. HK-1]
MSEILKLLIEQVYKEYPMKDGAFETLRDVSMAIRKGEFISIIGPSGSGKSTLFKLISGLEVPTSGKILLDGDPVVRGNVGYMPQKDHLLPWRTVLDNVILGLEVKGIPKREARQKAIPYLKLFGLESFENEFPSSLSGGMKQRAALLRTILLEKDVLLLDEPFGALDEITRLQMQNWLLSIWEKLNHTILFVTHSIDEAIFLSDRIYVFSPRPATVKHVVEIPLPRPRKPVMMTDETFIQLKKELLKQLSDISQE